MALKEKEKDEVDQKFGENTEFQVEETNQKDNGVVEEIGEMNQENSQRLLWLEMQRSLRI